MIEFLCRYFIVLAVSILTLLVVIIRSAIIVIALLILAAFIRTLMLKKKITYYEFSTDEDDNKKLATNLSKLVQIETISKNGKKEIAKYRKFHTQLKKLYPNVFKKLEVVDIDGNLLLKWKGKNSNLNPILLMSHMDVVEAVGKWSHKPFAGEITDGKVWGRGAADTKGSLSCFYQAVEELIKEKYTPNCDIYLASSCTEEIGGDGAPKIVEYLKSKNVHLHMLDDEGGWISQDPIKGIKGYFAQIGICEKGIGDLKFVAKSKGGHAAMPGKNTPIVRLANFESYIEKHNPFIQKFSPDTIRIFSSFAPYAENFGLRMILHNVKLFRPILYLVLPKKAPNLAAMLQTTIAFTMQKGSDGYNVLPQEASVNANLRYISHEPEKESIRKITSIARQFGLETEIVKSNDHSCSVDINGEAYKTVEEVCHKIWPGVVTMPNLVTGGTDSRFYDSVCDSCIRFAPLLFGPEQMKGIHGIDENIDIGSLRSGVNFYKELIKSQEKRK